MSQYELPQVSVFQEFEVVPETPPRSLLQSVIGASTVCENPWDRVRPKAIRIPFTTRENPHLVEFFAYQTIGVAVGNLSGLDNADFS